MLHTFGPDTLETFLVTAEEVEIADRMEASA